MRTLLVANSLRAVLLAASALVFCGCQIGQQMVEALGFEGKRVMASSDHVALPGETVLVEARLRKANIFAWHPKPTAVYIFHDGNLFLVAKTDANGEVSAPFTPPAPGLYTFQFVCYAQPSLEQPLELDCTVACLDPNRPVFISDIDHTISDQDERRDVIFGEPNAMPGSAPVLGRMARDYTVIYLTRRWDYLSKRTRHWMHENGFPAGPILAARGSAQVLADNEKYKTEMLRGVCDKLRAGGWGVGDQASDVRAYAACGLRAVLFIDGDDFDKAERVRHALAEVNQVPDSAQVAESWEEVEKIVFEGVKRSPSQAKDRLEKLLRTRS